MAGYKTFLREHKITVEWCHYRRQYVATSDTLGEDCSPYGEGKTQAAAIDDLDWQLEDIEERKLNK